MMTQSSPTTVKSEAGNVAVGNVAEPMALSVTDVVKSYGSGFSLGPVTFDLPMGYIMGLIGPNGAGKSTLIKLILNMIHRDAGSISVLGLDNLADEVKAKEQLGVVFDSSYFSTYWTVKMAEESMMAAYPTWNHALFADYLKQFGIDTKKKVKDLSRAVTAICALYAAFSAMMVFSNEETTGNTSMNGIVPVSRLNQVFARFALDFVADVITAIEGVLCLLILFHHDEPSVSLFVGLGLGVFGVALFLGGMVIPIFYKFTVTKAMGWSFAILGLLFFAVFLIGKIMPDNIRKRMVEWITTARLGVVPWAAIFAVLVAIVVCVCSFMLSVRVYERKEL